MKIEFDKEADALYVHLSEACKKVTQSKEIEEGIILDLDSKKKLLGIEILNVSKRFKQSDLFEYSVKHVEKSRLAL